MKNRNIVKILYSMMNVLVLIISGYIFMKDYAKQVFIDNKLNLIIILIILLFVFIVHLSKALRFYTIIKKYNIDKMDYIETYGRTVSVSMLFPFKLGEFYKAICYGYKIKGYIKSIVIVLYDRFIDSIGLLVVLAILYANKLINSFSLLYILPIFIVFSLVAYFVYPICSNSIKKILNKNFTRKNMKFTYAIKYLDELYDVVKEIIKSNIIFTIILSIFAWAIEYITFLFINNAISGSILFNEYLTPNVSESENIQIKIFTTYSVLILVFFAVLFYLIKNLRKKDVLNKDLNTRFFNSISGDRNELVKTSENKNKINAEYNFYYLLPERMRHWFVKPYDLQNNEKMASYKMEHIHAPNVASLWIENEINTNEIIGILYKYFKFFSERELKKCTNHKEITNNIYEKKVNDRIAELKKTSIYEELEKIAQIDGSLDIDFLVKKYFKLKGEVDNKIPSNDSLVIGHGDPCFSNTLYNLDTKRLIFVDPKGANTEEELWANPYYDIAKLSHSICGNYDFINNNRFNIIFSKNFKYELTIPFDNTKFKEIFKDYLKEYGFDYKLCRIYEASLFLSMLPLHIDDKRKVLAFIINARNILKEIEENV